MGQGLVMDLNFFTHPKTKKLQRRLGSEGVTSLIKLWSFVASQQPSGDLTGFAVQEIESASGWHGRPTSFVSTLIDLALLDISSKGIAIHGWEERQERLVSGPKL